MKRRRGSALVFVVIVVFSITSVVLVTAKLSSASATEYTNRLQEAQFKSMSDGVVAQVKSDSYLNTITTGTRNTAYDRGSVTTTVAQHPTLPRAYLLNIVSQIGDRTFAETKVIGNRAKPNPTYYGLWVGAAYSDSALNTNVTGSAYFASMSTLSGAWTVSNDFLTGGTATLSLGSTVGGHYLTAVRAQTMPISTAANYAGGTALGNTATNLTFGAESGGFYPVFSKGTGNLTLSGGTISGRGTVFVAGNLNINGNYNYADASSRVVFIVKGRITFGTLVTQAAGTYLAETQMSLSGVSLTVPRGNLCTNGAFNRLLCAVNVTQDTAFLDSPGEAAKHRLPGF